MSLQSLQISSIAIYVVYLEYSKTWFMNDLSQIAIFLSLLVLKYNSYKKFKNYNYSK